MLFLQSIYIFIGILPQAIISRAENISCSSGCSPGPDNKTEPCNITSGDCLFGCLPGYAGRTCSVECPSNCFQHLQNNTETCNAATEECLYGCQLGFVGPTCSYVCPDRCGSSSDLQADMCNTNTGECLHGCKDGFYGSNCTKSCTDEDRNCQRCVGKNDNSGIVCLECQRNFYGDSGKCLQCKYWCLSDPESPLPACRGNDGYCNHGCRPGRYGSKCGLRCRSTCKDTCDRVTGNCDGDVCKYTTYCGPTCDFNCQDGCVLQHCNITCGCIEGCYPNYWGRQCKKLCNANCIPPIDAGSRRCDRSDGTCLYGCKDNKYWGNECKDSCSEGCVNETCQQESGNCSDGCKSKTVFGERCDTTCHENCLEGTCERADGYCDKGCATGRYGEQCDLKCNTNCINITCERENGSCDNGCITGFYGEQCENVCSDNCLGLKCDSVGGNCTDGCISGYQGFQCKSVIPRHSLTNTNGGKTAGCNNIQSFIIAMIVGVTVGVLGTLVVVSIIYVTTLRKTTDKGTGQLKKSTTQTTYVNLGFNPDSTANQDDTRRMNDTDIARGDEDNSDTQYTSLDHSTNDSSTAYDIIQRI